MNDTHGVAGKGWHGFDLDGTLAVYDKWEGIDHIGEPVKPMVDLIKKMHEDGEVVKILTARVSPRENPEEKPNPYYAGGSTSLPSHADAIVGRNPRADGDVSRNVLGAFYSMETWTAKNFVADWCLKHLGFLPEITHEKDHLMLDLYDDRVKQVVPNKGLLVEDLGPKVEIHPIEVRGQRLDFFDRAAMAIGKIFIWTSVMWCFVWGVPTLIMKFVK